jgi:hypothetical protein
MLVACRNFLIISLASNYSSCVVLCHMKYEKYNAVFWNLMPWSLIGVLPAFSIKTVLRTSNVTTILSLQSQGRAIAQAVSRWLPTAAARVQSRVWSCGILWWTKVARGRFSPRTSVSPANLHSICFFTIIFTITRGWHNRPGVAVVPIASQIRIKKKKSTVLPQYCIYWRVVKNRVAWYLYAYAPVLRS